MKRLKLIFLGMFIFTFCFSLGYAQTDGKIEALEKRIEQLENVLEKQKEKEKEEKGAIIDTIAERIEFHGELEAGFKVDSIKRRGISKREDSSDFDLITAGFSIEARVTDWISVTAVPLFEIDDLFIDEAYATIGPTENIPFYMSAGLHYFPFGRREAYTHFPDDPLVNLPITLFFGEIQDPGLILGFSKQIRPSHSVTIEGYIFKPWKYACGSYDGIKETSHADSFGFDAHYNFEKEDYSFEIGGSWTSNIMASSGIKDFFEDYYPEIDIDSKIDAISTYMSGQYKNFYFTAEYMQAIEPFDRNLLPDKKGSGAHPRLWTFELGANIEDYFGFPVPVETMFRYAGSTEAQSIYDVPKNRFAVGLNIGIYKYTTWSLAYVYDDQDPNFDERYGEVYGRNNTHLFFTQVAVAF